MTTHEQDRPRVVMLISNGYEPDIRVYKEAHTLSLSGFRVTVLAWDRARRHESHMLETAPVSLKGALTDAALPVVDDPVPVTVTRIHVPAGYRTGRHLLAKLPLFWWRTWQELRRLRPQVVHAHDLDTLPVGYLYHRLTGVPVVYDAREYYPGMVEANVGHRISVLLEWLDRWLAPRVDGIITVGERLAARYRAAGGRVWVVHNSQPLPEQGGSGETLRRWLGVPDDALLVVYVGMLAPDRMLNPMLEAVPLVENAWFVVGGDGPLRPDVESAAQTCRRIVSLGWVPLEQVPALVAASDVVYYGLNESNRNSVYFMPNLAFFAFGAGRPLLTTPVGEIADLVRREGSGLVMETATPAAAVDALHRLSETAYRASRAARACEIGRSKYNWSYAAAQLLAAYCDCMM
jgi:glycosyltransferase involved in cell wall biosynthesis